MTEIALYIVQTLGGIYAGICILRLMLQLVRADYYNAVSQAIVMLTKAPISVLRPVFPSVARVDTAALVWALLVGYLGAQGSAFIVGWGFLSPLTVIAWSFAGLLNLFLSLIFYALIGTIIVSWISLFAGRHISHPLIDLANQVVAPFLAPIQRLLPSMGGLDLSPIFLFILISAMQMVARELAITVGVLPALVLGY